MKATRVLAGVVLGLAAAGLAAGCKPSAPTPDKQVQNAKTIVTGLRGTFEAGRLVVEPDPRGGDTQDMRMSLVIGVIEKVRYNVSKRETNETRKKAALAKIDEFIKAFDEVAPKYQQAVNARKTEAAKDLAACMRTLEAKLDELTAVLQGRAA